MQLSAAVNETEYRTHGLQHPVCCASSLTSWFFSSCTQALVDGSEGTAAGLPVSWTACCARSKKRCEMSLKALLLPMAANSPT